MDGSLSPLELLHPDGTAPRAVVVGDGCPDQLVPSSLLAEDGPCDLVVIAPGPGEGKTTEWFRRALDLARRRLVADGVAYLLVTRRARRRALRALARSGLSADAAFLHLPSADQSRQLVPLSARPASYAFSNLVPARPSRRLLALAVLSLPGGARLLARMAPVVGVVARQSPSRQICQWLFDLDGAVTPAPAPVITASWQDPRSAFVLHRFAQGGDAPPRVAKIRPSADSGAGPAGEAEILGTLAAAARQAGVETPEPLRVESLDGRSLLLETAVSGRSAAAVLGDDPRRVPALQARLARWLESWSRLTARPQPLEAARLAADLIAPAELLAPLITDGGEYVDWLAERSAELAGTTVPLVSAHNDLTMANVLVAGSGSLGVVDWEAARADGLPLTDFFYSAADAAAAGSRYDDRTAAFVDCFGPEGCRSAALGELEESLRRALGLTPPVAQLCFHACWLHHGANEHRAVGREGRESTARPFLEIVRWVARHRARA
jgi:hypothetical protein